MNLIYSSPHYCIVAYPAQQGFELLDKTGFRSLFLLGAQAWRFRHAMEDIPPAERTEEAIDALLDDYCADAARPIVIH